MIRSALNSLPFMLIGHDSQINVAMWLSKGVVHILDLLISCWLGNTFSQISLIKSKRTRLG